MFKKILILLISITLFSACELRKKDAADNTEQNDIQVEENLITVEDGQAMFDTAFVGSQKSYIDQKKSDLKLDVVINVEDADNDIFPKNFESMSGSLIANWDFANIQKATADLLLSMTFNGKKDPDLLFSAKLANGNLSMMLSKFNKEFVSLLGLEEIFNGINPGVVINEKYLGQENVIYLTDEQINEIAASFIGNDADSIKKNTDEQATVDSFIKNKVVTITGGNLKEGTNVLSFEAKGDMVAGFLNNIAKLNGINKDFSEYLNNVVIAGTVTIKNDKIINFSAQVARDDGTVEEPKSVTLMNVNYSAETIKFSSWSFVLMNTETGMSEMKIEVSY